MYTENHLVAIAKRENNNKRKYLVVNKLQGKHIAVSPSKAVSMFESLADMVKEAYPKEKLLLVGFAETATAIGAALAVYLDSYYMQTTREKVDDVEYLYFSESHSHATEQKLIKTDLDQMIDQIDRIVFVEDEVTTGNTILQIVELIKETYEKKVSFSVASILNGMTQESQKRYEEKGIAIHYLVKTNHAVYTERAEKYESDGTYAACNSKEEEVPYEMLEAGYYVNARRLTRGREYMEACEKLWEEIRRKVSEQDRILVLGTEECMYPAIYVGKKLEEQGKCVRTHSTTRSPIVVSKSKEYPLHDRYELVSMYDICRKTFLYDINRYDQVIIVTDAPVYEEGKNALLNAVAAAGNTNIMIVRWC